MNEVLVAHDQRRLVNRKAAKDLVWRAFSACALSGLYAWRMEDRWLRVERREMPLPNLGADLEGATLAHISDLHCSPIVLERYLRQCVEKINEMGVDFVAITGDFITGPRQYGRRIARVLKHLAPRIATVACLGNHDYGIFHPGGLGGMRGLGDYMAEQLSRADIFVMLNEVRTFRRGDSSIQFVGLEDYWSGRFDPDLAFDMACRRTPTVALVHNPDGAPRAADFGAAWVLSGHTHGSGMPRRKWANAVLPTHHKQFSAGHYELANGSNLYVNRGLSYGRRQSILNARPEVTLFVLRRATA